VFLFQQPKVDSRFSDGLRETVSTDGCVDSNALPLADVVIEQRSISRSFFQLHRRRVDRILV